jgi:2-oxoglutarate ferredoxin oxidoreductase subunit alpha
MEAVQRMNAAGKKTALAHFNFICPLPKNTEKVLRKYKKIVVAEQNNGQFAGYLTGKIQGLSVSRYNKVEGRPFEVQDLIDAFTKKWEE